MEMAKEFYYRVADGDNLSKICQQFNTEPAGIVRNNCDIPLYVGEWVKICVNDFITHFVKPAETIASIAARYSIDKEKLIADNNLSGEKLFIGQKLKIKLN